MKVQARTHSANAPQVPILLYVKLTDRNELLDVPYPWKGIWVSPPSHETDNAAQDNTGRPTPTTPLMTADRIGDTDALGLVSRGPHFCTASSTVLARLLRSRSPDLKPKHPHLTHRHLSRFAYTIGPAPLNSILPLQLPRPLPNASDSSSCSNMATTPTVHRAPITYDPNSLLSKYRPLRARPTMVTQTLLSQVFQPYRSGREYQVSLPRYSSWTHKD